MPGLYRVTISATGFQSVEVPDVHVDVTERTTVNVEMAPAAVVESVTVSGEAALVRRSGPQLGHVIESRAVSALPLATRNVTQMLALSPGATTYLPDNTGVGRNTQTISVNGARVTQNNFELDGIDVNTMGSAGAITLPVPAPDAIEPVPPPSNSRWRTFAKSRRPAQRSRCHGARLPRGGAQAFELPTRARTRRLPSTPW